MRVKRILLIALACCTMFASAGCWDARDINEKALVTLVLTDRQGSDYVFYAEIPNLAMGQQQSGIIGYEQYDIISGAGPTYAEARRQLDTKMDKPVFLGTVRALVLTDELLSYGVEEYFYRMQTMVDYRRALNVVTTHDAPDIILGVRPENNIARGYEIDETIASLKATGKIAVYTVSDVLEFLYRGTSFVLINMDVYDNRLAYNGYTIIHNGKYVGFIPLAESKGVVWLLGDRISRYYPVQIDGVLVTVKVNLKNRNIKAKYENGQVSFDIRFSFESRVLYLDKDIRLDERLQSLVKNKLQVMLADDIATAVSQSRAYQTDYLGFSESFRIAYPNIYPHLVWDTVYENATFNISAKTTLDPGGMMDLEAHGETLQ